MCFHIKPEKIKDLHLVFICMWLQFINTLVLFLPFPNRPPHVVMLLKPPLPFSLSSLPQEQGRGAPPCDFMFTQGLSWSTQYEPSRPLKVGDEHHEALQGPRMSLKVTLGLAPSSAMFRAQRGMVGSQALPVSEASGSWWVCNKVSGLLRRSSGSWAGTVPR